MSHDANWIENDFFSAYDIDLDKQRMGRLCDDSRSQFRTLLEKHLAYLTVTRHPVHHSSL